MPPSSVPVPLARAYAHSDCEQKRPLLDALDNGFTSFEADVWLVNGQLLVGHDLKDLRPGRTLESVYLKPLLDHIRKNKGDVYPPWPHSIQILIDIKSKADSTYKAIHELLEKYKEIFTAFSGGIVHEAAVTAIISGNRPRRAMESQEVRYAAYDGRLAELGDGSKAFFMPVVSDNWNDHFVWQGKGPISEKERQKLRNVVKTAQANGQRCRFWATPDTDPASREAVWKELIAAGIDYINTDHLPALRTWLLLNDPHPSVPVTDWFTPSGEKPGVWKPLHMKRDKWVYRLKHAQSKAAKPGVLGKQWAVHAVSSMKDAIQPSKQAVYSLKRKISHFGK